MARKQTPSLPRQLLMAVAVLAVLSLTTLSAGASTLTAHRSLAATPEAVSYSAVAVRTVLDSCPALCSCDGSPAVLVNCDLGSSANFGALAAALRSADLSATVTLIIAGKISYLPEDGFAEFGLSALEVLDLSNCSILSVAAGAFSGLTNLRSLDLSGNLLSQLFRGQFSDLVNLRSLYLNGNGIQQLPGPHDSPFADVGRTLAFLDLSSNPLMFVPRGAFSDLGQLRALHLYTKDMPLQDTCVEFRARFVPGAFLGLQNVTELIISDGGSTPAPPSPPSPPSSPSPPPIPPALPSCAVLLSEAGGEPVPGGMFDGLDSLVSLDLSQVALNLSAHFNASTTAAAFRGVQNIQNLDMSRQSLSSVPPLCDAVFNRLVSLSLRSSGITNEIPGAAFACLSHLRSLDLSLNSFTSVAPTAFVGLSSLESLDLTSVLIDDLPLGIFDPLRNLKVLRFDAQSILKAYTFKVLAHLQELDLAAPSLLEAEALADLAELKSLRLRQPQHGSYSLLPNSFANTPALESLEFQEGASFVDGRITAASSHALSALQGFTLGYSLQSIQRNPDLLTALDPAFFETFSSLRSLDLSPASGSRVSSSYEIPVAFSFAMSSLLNLETLVLPGGAKFSSFQFPPRLETLALVYWSYGGSSSLYLPAFLTKNYTSPTDPLELPESITTLHIGGPPSIQNSDLCNYLSPTFGVYLGSFPSSTAMVARGVTELSFPFSYAEYVKSPYNPPPTGLSRSVKPSLTSFPNLASLTLRGDRNAYGLSIPLLLADLLSPVTASLVSLRLLCVNVLGGLANLGVWSNMTSLMSLKHSVRPSIADMQNFSSAPPPNLKHLDLWFPQAAIGSNIYPATPWYLQTNMTSLIMAMLGSGSPSSLRESMTSLKYCPYNLIGARYFSVGLDSHELADIDFLLQLDLSDCGPDLTTLTNPHFVLSGSPFASRTRPSRLQTLALKNNGIQHVNMEVFLGLTSLQELDLSENQLSVIPAGTFSPLTALTFLNLSGNPLVIIQPGLFAGLNSLQTLDLSNLRPMPQKSPSPGFPYSAFVELLAGALDDLTGLKNLNMTSTRLSTVPGNIFGRMGALAMLNLSQCNAALEPMALHGMSALEVLDLTGNVLPVIRSGVPLLPVAATVRELYLGGCRTANVVSGAFAGFAVLEKLDLSGNYLGWLDPGLFTTGLSALKFLDLSANFLDCLACGVQQLAGITVLAPTATCAAPTSAAGLTIAGAASGSFPSPCRNEPAAPTAAPTMQPTNSAPSEPDMPTATPTSRPTTPQGVPTTFPTGAPTTPPTKHPTQNPTSPPTSHPTRTPTTLPTGHPTHLPTSLPTDHPTLAPTLAPTGSSGPGTQPTFTPTSSPHQKDSASTAGSCVCKVSGASLSISAIIGAAVASAVVSALLVLLVQHYWRRDKYGLPHAAGVDAASGQRGAPGHGSATSSMLPATDDPDTDTRPFFMPGFDEASSSL